MSTLVCGSFATAAPALASAQAVRESTPDQKIAAAREIPLAITPTQYQMTDCNFTMWVWGQTRQPSNAAVNDAAYTALMATSNPEACFLFITEGIYTAHQADVMEQLRKAQRDKQRIAAAAVVSWNNLTQGDLDTTIKEFVFRLWERAEANSEVKNKAAAVLTTTSTDEQRITYIVTDIFAARETDRLRRIEEDERRTREARERQENEDKRAHAWQVAAGAVLTQELKLMTDREFVYAIFSRGNGKWVKANARAASDTDDPKAWKAYIFTGVHAAHQKDLEDQNHADAIETEKRINEILTAAERDGYKPNLARAARVALSGDLGARHMFLDVGQHEALKLDLIKPENRRVVEMRGVGSDRCLQVWGAWEDAQRAGQQQELWDCVRGYKQIWELFQVSENEWIIRNLHSVFCLDVSGDAVAQNWCDSPSARWRFIENAADGSFQLQNIATGRYATAKDGGTTNATLIGLGSNTNAADQRWRLIDPTHRADVVGVSSGIVTIKGVESGRCLQIVGPWDRSNEGANADLAVTELWDCGLDKAKWEVIPLGHNRYSLKNKQSGKCLDVKHGRYVNGTSIVQFQCHYEGSEQFNFTQAVDNTLGLQSVLTGQFADAVGHATHNGAAVQTWDLTGQNNQRWTLVYDVG
ncbi:RICIN domain-containing protein [Lentzea sp. NPDC051838]|uniref:RICIN domain-containing protein n=1 Tax=Lentzea sp. NPDC051838 TaxID=3154849 RepID=UPI003447667E